MDTWKQVGAVIVGDEILSGERCDRHLNHLTRALAGRGLRLAWVQYVGDGLDDLRQTLTFTQSTVLPVLVFGGIGATPDDRTREAAARVFNSPLERHPEAQACIEAAFGEAAWPDRVLMADLPQDAVLIPNPHNDVPGFSLFDHFFLPGFPGLAWPMLEWVLERYFPQPDIPYATRV